MTFRQSSVSLKGTTLHFHTAGEGEPLLYFHTAAGVRLSPAIDRIAQSRKIYMPITPGFDGIEPIDGLNTIGGLADLMAQFVDEMVGKPCDVLGHSFGGRLAVSLATRHPAKIDHLILAAPAIFRAGDPGGLPTDPETLRRAMFAHPENLPPEQKSSAVMAQNRAMLEHYRVEVQHDRDMSASLGKIEAQTLIIQGTKDGIIPTASVHFLKHHIAQSFLIFVYDAAHALDIDQPSRFAQLVDDFLTRGEAFIVNRRSTTAA